jgi:hypothetical protein
MSGRTLKFEQQARADQQALLSRPINHTAQQDFRSQIAIIVICE